MSPENLNQRLEEARPKLSQTEQAELWQRIAPQVGTPGLVASPYMFVSLFSSRALVPIAVLLLVVIGAGSTVAVSEAAKPGDLLFPIDRATERARLALASESRAAELRTTFAAERLAELEAILSEEGTLLSHDDNVTTASSTGGSTMFEAEADVFTDITVVKVEISDQTRIFTTTATTREAVVAEIAERYGIAPSAVEAALDFEIEDRASRPGERGKFLVDDVDEARISIAASELLDLLEGVEEGSVRDGLLTALLSQIDNVTVRGREDRGRSNDDRSETRTEDSRVRIDDDRIEIREDGYRIRIEDDGEVRIKTDDDSRDDSGDNDSRDDSGDDDSRDDDSRGSDDDGDSSSGVQDDDSRDDEGDDDDSRGRGRGGDDDRDDDEDDDDKDEQNDDDEEEGDEDNSGSGSGKDDDEDDKDDDHN